MDGLDIGLAFLEGLALIVSPCILPVLPLVLATSADGGRRRPYGIIIGFVLAFSIFAILARKLVALLGIDLDLIRTLSLVLLASLGLVLLWPRLSAGFSALTQGLADFGNRLAGSGGQGLGSGIAIGALIGLVWTPCAGPILAAVLVQVIRQQTDLAGNLVIVSFAIGAGVPMLAIALLGRKLAGKLGGLVRHAEALRKAFGALILGSVALIASGVGAQSLPAPAGPTAGPLRQPLALENGLAAPYQAPQFSGIEAWLNSPALTMASLKGKVVLVDFWTYSCINCVRTLPYLTEWDRKYRNQGLVIVGVHSPEFAFERKLDNVKAAIAKHGIRYPVALDNRFDTWSNFNNRFWPAHYLIDRDGKVVYTHFGEGAYDVTENNIRFLLGLGHRTAAPPASADTAAQTPETYLGYDRADSFGGPAPVIRDAQRSYRFPAALAEDNWALDGKWQVGAEKIVAGDNGAALRLDFTARKVFLVLGTAGGKPVHAQVRVNGELVGSNAGADAAAGMVLVDGHTLYELVDQKSVRKGLLEIRSQAPGLEAYAFTFGS